MKQETFKNCRTFFPLSLRERAGVRGNIQTVSKGSFAGQQREELASEPRDVCALPRAL